MKRQDPGACLARLNQLLAHESSCLERSDIGSATALLEEKLGLAAVVRDFAVDGSLRAIPDATAALRQLRLEIDRNKHALEHAMRVQHVLVGIIADASRRSLPVQSYGRSGLAVTSRPGRMLGSCRA